jgi:hypothetical protein
MAVKLDTTSKSNALLIDTVANVSVFTDTTLFLEMHPPDTSISVRFGPTATLAAESIGRVMFMVTDHSEGIHTITVDGVLYVPTQPHNILCLKDMFGLGRGVNFDISPYCVRWKVNATDAYQHISFVDNLQYSITIGHIGASKLKQLQALDHLRNSDQLSEHGFDCEVCTRANARLDPYPLRLDIRATHPNHTFHADLLILPKEGPYLYLLLIMDECTRYVFLIPLVTKDKAAEGLLCTMKRAHVLHTHRIKYVHTNQRGEFQSTVLHIAKEELGTEAEIVPARWHESNGLIERVNKTIQEKFRALLIAACLPHSF